MTGIDTRAVKSDEPCDARRWCPAVTVLDSDGVCDIIRFFSRN